MIITESVVLLIVINNNTIININININTIIIIINIAIIIAISYYQHISPYTITPLAQHMPKYTQQTQGITPCTLHALPGT
jgi:hypothetical protein